MYSLSLFSKHELGTKSDKKKTGRRKPEPKCQGFDSKGLELEMDRNEIGKLQ